MDEENREAGGAGVEKPEPEKVETKAVAVRPPREVIISSNPVPTLDTAMFEQMQRVATVMARSSLMPESLREGMQPDTVLANCFLIVNQAVRWGMDPFAVAQCTSVIKGRLCYEGKLVSAVLKAKLGLELTMEFSGDEKTDGYTILLYDPNDHGRFARGSVADWKTSRAGSPWTVPNYRRMLIYRGTREWARFYASDVLLGVYTPDELDDLILDARSRRAQDVSPASILDRLPGPDGNGHRDQLGRSLAGEDDTPARKPKAKKRRAPEAPKGPADVSVLL